MKRISFLMFAMLIGSMSLFTACGDDDDNDTTPSGIVAGTYSGTLVASIEGQVVANEAKSLSLEKNGDNAVDVVIKEFTLNVVLGNNDPIPVNLGDLKVGKCTVAQKDGKSTFSGTENLTGVKVPLAPGLEVTADCKVDIVNATVEGNKLSLPIDVAVSTNGEELLSVKVQYTGTKK